MSAVPPARELPGLAPHAPAVAVVRVVVHARAGVAARPGVAVAAVGGRLLHERNVLSVALAHKRQRRGVAHRGLAVGLAVLVERAEQVLALWVQVLPPDGAGAIHGAKGRRPTQHARVPGMRVPHAPSLTVLRAYTLRAQVAGGQVLLALVCSMALAAAVGLLLLDLLRPLFLGSGTGCLLLQVGTFHLILVLCIS